jgi:hypothetical protein
MFVNYEEKASKNLPQGGSARRHINLVWMFLLSSIALTLLRTIGYRVCPQHPFRPSLTITTFTGFTGHTKFTGFND